RAPRRLSSLLDSTGQFDVDRGLGARARGPPRIRRHAPQLHPGSTHVPWAVQSPHGPIRSAYNGQERNVFSHAGDAAAHDAGSAPVRHGRTPEHRGQGCRHDQRHLQREVMSTSIWQDRAPAIPTDPFPVGGAFDVVVVGGGLTGLATAVMLTRAGLSVAVLEARSIGELTTARSTGKVSLLQGAVMSGIRRSHSDKVLHAYANGNREAQDWLLGFLEGRGVPVERRDALMYATTTEGVRRLEGEIEAARIAGLDIERVDGRGLPFEVSAAIRLADQAQIDPVAALRA